MYGVGLRGQPAVHVGQQVAHHAQLLLVVANPGPALLSHLLQPGSATDPTYQCVVIRKQSCPLKVKACPLMVQSRPFMVQSCPLWSILATPTPPLWFSLVPS